jgi:hypothetical protein
MKKRNADEGKPGLYVYLSISIFFFFSFPFFFEEGENDNNEDYENDDEDQGLESPLQQPPREMTQNISDRKKDYYYMRTVKSVEELDKFRFKVVQNKC